MKITAIYPGTFDPITLGHVDIVSRASSLFDNVILAVAASSSKNTVFSVEERVELARQVLCDLTNVEIEKFDGLMVDFARDRSASVVLRGLRAVSDFEYEFQLAGMNRKLMSEVDTIFILSRHEKHAPLVMDSLRLKKNVFVEKPLCVSLEELQEIKTIYSVGS